MLAAAGRPANTLGALVGLVPTLPALCAALYHRRVTGDRSATRNAAVARVFPAGGDAHFLIPR